MKIGCFPECQCEYSLTLCFLIPLWIEIAHLAGHRFYVDEIEDRSLWIVGERQCISMKYNTMCNGIMGKRVQEVAQGWGKYNLRCAWIGLRSDDYNGSYLYRGWHVLCCDLESVRCTSRAGFVLPILNVSIPINNAMDATIGGWFLPPHI